MQTTNDIKCIFSKLDSNSKNSARKQISDAYNVSIDTVKNRWIYGGEIPQKYTVGVRNIIRSVAQKQVNELQSLIDVI